jgi:hypothetical protein
VAIVSAQLIATLEKLGRITGEIASIAGNVTNINVAVLQSPEFARAQAAILRALANHSAARADVVAALRELDTDDPPERTRGPGKARPEPILIEHTPQPPAPPY